MENKDFTIDKRIMQHAMIKELCDNWIKTEQRLHPIATTSDIPLAVWYGIIDVNIFSFTDIDRVFSARNESNLAYTRLAQTYASCILTIGAKAMATLHKEMDYIYKQFNITDYKVWVKKYPFIVLLPTLNELNREKYYNVIFQLQPEPQIAL